MIVNKFGDWGANDYADYRKALNHFLDEEMYAEYNDLPPVGKRGTPRKKAKAEMSRKIQHRSYYHNVRIGNSGLTYRVTGYAPADIFYDNKYKEHIEEAQKIGVGKETKKKSTLAQMARG